MVYQINQNNVLMINLKYKLKRKLIPETTSTQKFAQERGGRNFSFGN